MWNIILINDTIESGEIFIFETNRMRCFVMGDYVSKLQSEEVDFLCDAILSLKNREECYKFFDDICTINEIKAMEQRLQVASMLKEGKTYLDIAAITGASTATISRVNRCLNYGSDGYNLIMKRISHTESNEKN